MARYSAQNKISLITIFNYPFHPFLFAVAPVLSLLGGNIIEITFGESVRSLTWSFTGAAVLFFLLLILTRNSVRAGLASSYILILFFTFGDVYLRLRSVYEIPANILAAVWAVLLIIGTWAILRLLRPPVTATVIVNVMALAAFAGSIYPLVVYNGHQLFSGPIEMRAPADLAPAVSVPPSRKPDIYYIILDGYGRSDALAEIHHVDNRDFLTFLERQGFTIASQSTTNYARTMHSLSSSLNFHYLDELLVPRPEENNYDAFRLLIKDNALQRFLKAQGYQTIALSTGFEITEVSNADIFLRNTGTMSYFEETLLSRTLAIFYIDQVVGDIRRGEIRQALENLESTAAIPGPKFIFAHLVVPHPPFVFDENGGPVAPRGWGDGTSYAGGKEQYLEAYRRQLLYVDTQVEALVEHILAQNETPPVIIIQGDHGPGALVDWIHWENTCFRERIPILNAYLLPGVSAGEIPQDITPVNTFRLVLNHYFNTQLAFEPNHNFMVTTFQPYQFIDVTDRIDSCPTLK